MISKSKKQSGAKKGAAKLPKLKIKGETVKNLSERDLKNIKGGLGPDMRHPK